MSMVVFVYIVAYASELSRHVHSRCKPLHTVRSVFLLISDRHLCKYSENIQQKMDSVNEPPGLASADGPSTSSFGEIEHLATNVSTFCVNMHFLCETAIIVAILFSWVPALYYSLVYVFANMPECRCHRER